MPVVHAARRAKGRERMEVVLAGVERTGGSSARDISQKRAEGGLFRVQRHATHVPAILARCDPLGSGISASSGAIVTA
jgi:hypothetical protein